MAGSYHSRGISDRLRVARKTYPTKKPYPTFPLTPRRDGRFAKKIRGQFYTFGRDGNWREALDEYLSRARALHAGSVVVPSQAPRQAPTVLQLVNRYLDERRRDVSAGTLQLGTWDDYRETLDAFANFIGKNVPVTELSGDHLNRFATHLLTASKKHKPVSHARYHLYRANVRACLRHAIESGWIDRFEFGAHFKRIPKAKIRQQRRRRMVDPHHLPGLIAAASHDRQLQTMILLALNCGFGNTDCATLQRPAIDLARKLIDFPRPKTGVERTAPLWDETARALAALLERRPDDPYVFRTKYGNLWVRTEENEAGRIVTKDSIAQAFDGLRKSFCLWPRIGESDTFASTYPDAKFYALRHIHRTLADEVLDHHAAARIMGHSFPGMSGEYIEEISMQRLRAVVDHVHSRIFG